MVEQVTTYITANWVEWLFAGAYAILIALYKKEKQQHKEEREENKKRTPALLLSTNQMPG